MALDEDTAQAGGCPGLNSAGSSQQGGASRWAGTEICGTCALAPPTSKGTFSTPDPAPHPEGQDPGTARLQLTCRSCSWVSQKLTWGTSGNLRTHAWIVRNPSFWGTNQGSPTHRAWGEVMGVGTRKVLPLCLSQNWPWAAGRPQGGTKAGPRARALQDSKEVLVPQVEEQSRVSGRNGRNGPKSTLGPGVGEGSGRSTLARWGP